jgi:hypothetical protein
VRVRALTTRAALAALRDAEARVCWSARTGLPLVCDYDGSLTPELVAWCEHRGEALAWVLVGLEQGFAWTDCTACRSIQMAKPTDRCSTCSAELVTLPAPPFSSESRTPRSCREDMAR